MGCLKNYCWWPLYCPPISIPSISGMWKGLFQLEVSHGHLSCCYSYLQILLPCSLLSPITMISVANVDMENAKIWSSLEWGANTWKWDFGILYEISQHNFCCPDWDTVQTVFFVSLSLYWDIKEKPWHPVSLMIKSCETVETSETDFLSQIQELILLFQTWPLPLHFYEYTVSVFLFPLAAQNILVLPAPPNSINFF